MTVDDTPNPPFPNPDAGKGSFVHAIRPRDTSKVLLHNAAYTRFVRIVRWVLPLIILGVLVTLVVWPLLRSHKMNTIVAASIPNLVVENLHLTGIDASNQPYSLTAGKALQAAGMKGVMDLEHPQAEVTLTNGAWLAGEAQYGRVDQATKKLWLGGNVQLFHDQGYQFTTNEMQVDLNNNNAWGEQPVLIQGGFGEIRGTGFRLLDNGSVMIIYGHATAKLNMNNLSEPTEGK